MIQEIFMSSKHNYCVVKFASKYNITLKKDTRYKKTSFFATHPFFLVIDWVEKKMQVFGKECNT
jgi:hypothetical protein